MTITTKTKFEKNMKTITKFAYFCAIALTGVSYLASCSSDEVEVNPNYDAERGVVKTEFTISLPAKAVGTRMTAETVQATEDFNGFRGIQDIKLYPFNAKVSAISGTNQKPDAITLLGTTATVSQTGPSGTENNQIAKSGALFTGNNAHLYQDIEIAIGTQAFMFYGMAIPAAAPKTHFDNGTLTDNLSTATTLGDITFSPVKIYGDNLGANATAIETYLTGIANASGWSTSNNVILRTLYNKFISMKAGSWASVKGAVQQLYTSLWSKTFATTADNTVKDAILAAILTTQATDAGGTTPNGTLNFQELGNFPADISLPDGAIHMNWQDKANAADGKEFKIMSSTATDNTGLNIADLTKYVYPAPLYYRALSNIRTADKSMLSYYNSKTVWDDGDREATEASHDDVLDGYGAEVTSGDNQNDIVKYTTRSIAVVDQIQYAVGRLDVTVKANAANVADNSALLEDMASDKSIPLTRTEGSSTVNCFPVTGLLISNQNSVDYLFKKKGTESYTIYDKVIPDGICLTNTDPSSATTIHTLVFETAEATAAEDANAIVKIAVEFQNNSGDWFAGKDGEFIYPGGKFYLVGTFDPKATTNTTANPGNLAQVFKQDYTTTANLIIGSLKNAYNTLPDLRAPQLELGLSVNLSWNKGITQTITIN